MKPTRSGMIAAALATALLAPGPAPAQQRFLFEYSVKVVCGKVSDDSADAPLAPGRYYTAVNLHNPAATATFRFKVATALPGRPGPVSRFEPSRLGPDEAMEIDCPLIHRVARDERWVKGFVVIQSSHQLDVVAVYTTSGRGPEVNSFHTERVPVRRIG